MSLSDAALGHDEPDVDEGGGMSVEPMGIDCKHCAAEIMKAVKNNDVNGLEQALRLFMVACDQEEDGGDDDGGY